MRLLLFLALLGGLVFFGLRSCSTAAGNQGSVLGRIVGGDHQLPAVLQESKPEADGSVLPAPDDLTVRSSQAEALTPDALKELEKPVRQHFELVTFKHRNMPAVEFWSSLSQVGVKAFVDVEGRTAMLSGDEQTVVRAAVALRQTDVVPQACSLRCWAVYVDRNVSKGWDLMAALGAVLDAPDGVKIGSGRLTFDVSGDDIAAALTIVADGSAVEVLQNPHVRLLNRELAKVEAIQEVPLPSAVVSNGVSQSNIQYRKVGLQLEVTPEFFGEDRVRLKIAQTNGLVGSSVMIDGASVPIIESQTVASSVEITVGQAVVLGGVRTVRQRTSRGLLRDKTEVQEGSLYVILATSNDEPRAVLLDEFAVPIPPGLDAFGSPPFALPAEAAADWIDGELLPEKGWQSQERDFLRARAAK